MKIFEFHCYREYIGFLFHERKKSNKHFSYQYAANVLGKSKSFLKLIIEKKRHVSLDQLPAIARLFNLNEDELHYLTLLVIKNTLNDESLTSYFSNVLLKLKSRHVYRKSLTYEDTPQGDILFLSWLSLTIHSMAKLQGFEPTVSWIAPRLRDEVSHENIEIVVNRLLQNNSIVRTDSGWKPAQYIFQEMNEYDLSGMKVFKIGTSKATQCLDQLEKYNPSTNYMMTVGVKKKDADMVMEKFLTLRNELIELSKATTESEMVFFVSNNIFTLADCKDHGDKK